MSRNIDVNKQRKQGRNSTPSSNGSVTSSWKKIQHGLQGVIRGYLQAPLASTLPQLEFPMAGPSTFSSSSQLKEGLRQTSDIITGMSDQALLDQGSQGSRKNVWKTTLAKTVTPKKKWEKEEDKAGNVCFIIQSSLVYCCTPRT